MHSKLGCNAEFIRGVDNLIADYISRSTKSNPHDKPPFESLHILFPQTASCARLIPSAAFISKVFDALRFGQYKDLTKPITFTLNDRE